MRDEKTYKIIGAAIEVHKELGCGFLENVTRAGFAVVESALIKDNYTTLKRFRIEGRNL